MIGFIDLAPAFTEAALKDNRHGWNREKESAMKITKCPFLETITVTYCKAFPVKMIPADRASSQKGMCNSAAFPECALYKERSRPSADVEENAIGFHLHSG